MKHLINSIIILYLSFSYSCYSTNSKNENIIGNIDNSQEEIQKLELSPLNNFDSPIENNKDINSNLSISNKDIVNSENNNEKLLDISELNKIGINTKDNKLKKNVENNDVINSENNTDKISNKDNIINNDIDKKYLNKEDKIENKPIITKINKKSQNKLKVKKKKNKKNPHKLNKNNNLKNQNTEITFEHQKFINNETIMLTLTSDDDIVLGKISKLGRKNEVEYSNYISNFWRDFERNISNSEKNKINYYLSKISSYSKINTLLSKNDAKHLILESTLKQDLELIRTILDYYPQVNLKFHHGNTLLHISAIRNLDLSAKYLLIKGIDIEELNYHNLSAINISDSLLNYDISKLILNAKYTR